MTMNERTVSLRKGKGMSQELLAENSRISLRTIQRIEAGKTIPRPYTMKVIADALGVEVDQLNGEELHASSQNSNVTEQTLIRIINLSALSVLILPFVNIILPFLIWWKNRGIARVDVEGRKIISFQILWTLSTGLAIILIQLLLTGLTRSVTIGRLPPTVVLCYLIFVIVNVFFVLRSAVHLSKGEPSSYDFAPTLL